MKVLVVDPDVTRAPSLKMALAAGGAEVTLASSGSFALTMLEWNRHEVVVSQARIDDMDGHELCAILKADPSTRNVRFVLVAGADEVTAAQTTAAGVDLVLAPTIAVGALGPLVARLAQGDAAPRSAPPAAAPEHLAAAPAPPTAPAPPAAPAPPPPAAPAPMIPKLRPDAVTTPVPDPPKRYVTAEAAAAAAPWSAAPATPVASPATAVSPPPAPTGAPVDLASMPSGTFQGSLEVMDLADLTQAIANGGKTGRLILSLGGGGGLIAFAGGRVVHAEYRSAVGEPAFAALLAGSQGNGSGRFCFLPSPAGETPSPTRTITKSVDSLLLSIATAIDEKG